MGVLMICCSKTARVISTGTYVEFGFSALALYFSGRPTVHTAIRRMNGLRETYGSAILSLARKPSASDRLCREGRLGNEQPMSEKGK